MADFIHLRNHTQYSLMEGMIPLSKLVGLTKERKQPAVALTDTNSMFGALEFSTYASEAGVKPITGIQVSLRDDAGEGDLVLLAKNEEGYLNLMRLTKTIYMRESGEHFLTLDEIREHASDLICLSGGPSGPIARHVLNGDFEQAEVMTDALKEVFGDNLYMEIQRHPDEDGVSPAIEVDSEPHLLDLAYSKDIPIVATNDNRFVNREGFGDNDVLMCVAQKTTVKDDNRKRYTENHYLKTPEEMVELFADLPEAIENTLEIAQRCSHIVPKRDPILPKFAENEAGEIRERARKGLRERLDVIDPVVSVKEYEDRLDFELGIIEQMGFPGYFLIVSDFIQWAKSNDIPVGPGRGSGAGSLVAYALNITDLDPLRYGLLFERFLNPERVSMPDFDIDFCMDRREEVMEYVQDKYGSDRVGQIITFGGLLSKSAVKDAGRALGVPYSRTEAMSKMIPSKGPKPVSIPEAIEMEPRFKQMMDEDADIEAVMTHAAGIEGYFRSAGTHAAGVVIADRPIEELVPVYRDPKSEMPATQFNMKWVEQAGLVKFDFLGLKTLTVIKRAEQFIKETGEDVDISMIPIDDPKTFELLSNAETKAVFQVESAGMMDALRRMRPNRIEDIVALVALYRPGPMAQIPVYCDVKNGKEAIHSIHPLVDPILEETQGIIVYQEQVMEVARKMAGYTLGGADLLRRAMGKKIAAEMAKERPKFIEGAIKNGVEERKAGEVFDLLEKFADYGFNKSHAAAYALISYQTAWLKANYPVQFMAAVMSCDSDLTDKLNGYVQEAERMGIETLNPSINASDVNFTVRDDKIIYGLSALKGVGEKSVVALVEERKNNGPYKDIADFAGRVDLKALGKGTLEALIRSGSLDEMEPNRKKLMDGVPALISWSRTKREMTNDRQVDLFAQDFEPPKLPNAEDWDNAERMTNEHKAIGFYLTGHPLDQLMPSLRRVGVKAYEEVANDVSYDEQVVNIAGTVAERTEKTSKKGNRFAFVSLSDPSGSFEVVVFGKQLEQMRSALEPGSHVVMKVRCAHEDESLKLSAMAVMPVHSALPQTPATGLLVRSQSESVEALIKKAVSEQPQEGMRGDIKLVYVENDEEKIRTVVQNAPIGPSIREVLGSLNGVKHIEELGGESRIKLHKVAPKHKIGNGGVRGADRTQEGAEISLDNLVLNPVSDIKPRQGAQVMAMKPELSEDVIEMNFDF